MGMDSIPPMDGSMGMEDPSMGDDESMDDMPPMGEDPTQDPSMGDDGSMDDMQQQGQDEDDDEIMDIINSLSIEDKAAVEKYAKSMADDSSNDSNDNMPMESRYRSIKSMIDETISSYLYDDDDEEDRTQKLPKEYNGFKSPFKSPYE